MPQRKLIILSGCRSMVMSKKPKSSIPSKDPTAADIDWTPWLSFRIKTRLLNYTNVLLKRKLISILKNTWTQPNMMERCLQWPLETIKVCFAMGGKIVVDIIRDE